MLAKLLDKKLYFSHIYLNRFAECDYLRNETENIQSRFQSAYFGAYASFYRMFIPSA